MGEVGKYGLFVELEVFATTPEEGLAALKKRYAEFDKVIQHCPPEAIGENGHTGGVSGAGLDKIDGLDPSEVHKALWKGVFHFGPVEDD